MKEKRGESKVVHDQHWIYALQFIQTQFVCVFMYNYY